MGGDSVVEFDPNALKARVAETVQVAFGKLIPEDQWVQMVDKEVKAFFELEVELNYKEKTVYRSRGEDAERWEIRATMTPFRLMVWEQLQDLIGKKLRQQLESPGFSTDYVWDGQDKEYQLGDVLLAKLEEMGPKMASLLFQDMFARMAESMKNIAVTALQDERRY